VNVQNWFGAISAHTPIFSAMTIEANIRRAWSLYRQAGLAQLQVQRQITDDVNQGYRNFVGSRQRIAELSIQENAAQRAFDLAERGYTLSTISNIDRLTQQNNLLSAQLDLVTEELNEKEFYLSLLRSNGKLYSTLITNRQANQKSLQPLSPGV